jgi:hypothetical protein
VITTDDKFDENLGKASFDSRNKICKVYSNVNYLIYYSEVGYQENPKKYIAKIEKSTSEEEWTNHVDQ